MEPPRGSTARGCRCGGGMERTLNRCVCERPALAPTPQTKTGGRAVPSPSLGPRPCLEKYCLYLTATPQRALASSMNVSRPAPQLHAASGSTLKITALQFLPIPTVSIGPNQDWPPTFSPDTEFLILSKFGPPSPLGGCSALEVRLSLLSGVPPAASSTHDVLSPGLPGATGQHAH